MTDDNRVLYLGRHLLDHQIVSADHELVGKVDDLVLEPHGDGPPVVTELLTGQIAYGDRVHGRLGTLLRDMATRLRGTAGGAPRRFDITLVKAITHTVILNVPDGDVPPPDLEHWLSEHVIGRLPGAGR
jgi:hypothetical protein